jgi:tetratricopeptide (TPR) repeat protein
MAYVRRRGNQLAIVRGVRSPETKKVEQEILFTIYSKGEAAAALGEGAGGDASRFRSLVERAHPDVRFDWKAISSAIAENLEVLPETYDYCSTRLHAAFRRELLAFTRQIVLTDPLDSAAARQLVDEQREALEYLRELIGRRLAAPPQAESEWTADNAWHWRFASRPADVPPDVEEHAAGLYERQEYRRAAAAFRLLTEAFPDYAEGHNYLGLIALDQRRPEEAVEHFKRTIEVGRRLLPRRVPRSGWWSDHRTRPYMRGLRNLALSLVHAKRYEEALGTCDRLVTECDDAITASAHRASAYLDTGRWREALDAARHIHQISPGDSLLAAFAAFELGREGEARALFLHAALNKPRTVGSVLGARFARPRDREEAVDHNDGILLARTLDDFLRRRRPASRRFFAGLWEHPMVKDLREEMALVTARWQADRQGRDRAAFHRMQELRSWEFASRAWGPDGPPHVVSPPRASGRGRRQLH